jgi:hypothetical protein
MHNLDKKLKEYWHEKTQGGVVANTLRYAWPTQNSVVNWSRLNSVCYSVSVI